MVTFLYIMFEFRYCLRDIKQLYIKVYGTCDIYLAGIPWSLVVHLDWMLVAKPAMTVHYIYTSVDSQDRNIINP